MDVDQNQLGTTWCCLRFKVTLKVGKDVGDLELNMKGTREEDCSVIIANYELLGMLCVVNKITIVYLSKQFTKITKCNCFADQTTKLDTSDRTLLPLYKKVPKELLGESAYRYMLVYLYLK